MCGDDVVFLIESVLECVVTVLFFLVFCFAVLLGGGMLKHTKRSTTKTTKSIEKPPRGTLVRAFAVPLSVLGAPLSVLGG